MAWRRCSLCVSACGDSGGGDSSGDGDTDPPQGKSDAQVDGQDGTCTACPEQWILCDGGCATARRASALGPGV